MQKAEQGEEKTEAALAFTAFHEEKAQRHVEKKQVHVVEKIELELHVTNQNLQCACEHNGGGGGNFG